MNAQSRKALTGAEIAEDSASYLASYRARGGFAAALRRQAGLPSATAEHMPFPGHRHMGEIG